jgi:hypothetical protein
VNNHNFSRKKERKKGSSTKELNDFKENYLKYQDFYFNKIN